MQGHKRTGPEDGLDDLLRGLEDLTGAGAAAVAAPTEPSHLLQEGSSGNEPADRNGLASSEAQTTDSDELGSEHSELRPSAGSVGSESLSGSELQAAHFRTGATGASAASSSSSSSSEGSDAVDSGSDDTRSSVSNSDDDFDRAPGIAKQAAKLPAQLRGSTKEQPGSFASNNSNSSDDSDSGVDCRSEQADPATHTEAQVTKPTKPSGRYIPPALRQKQADTTPAAETHAASAQGDHEQALAAVRRQVLSLMNRVATANLAGIAQQLMAALAPVPRHLGVEAVVDTLMQVCILRLNVVSVCHLRSAKALDS